MNINQLKAFLGEKPPHLGSEGSIQNQMRESGLRQAASFQAGQVQPKADQFSSSSTFGVRVYANALHSTLEINSRRPDFSVNKSAKPAIPAFDFEEVAKNVLKFVGGALKNAQAKGADDAELTKLFEQASSGVLKGIKMAEKDLAGFMNGEIRSGIDNSKKLIDEGIEKLKQDIFGKQKNQAASDSLLVAGTTQITVSEQKSGQLVIKTKDGDEVSLTFEDARRFELNQQLLLRQQNTLTEKEGKNPDDEKISQPATVKKPVIEKTATETAPDKTQLEQAALQNEKKPDVGSQSTVAQNSIYYESLALSFSVSGELDADELKAIGKLVADANDLADEFFNGDIETAYNQALKLGFDDQELTSFALQLTKVENTQVIKAYETVSHYDQENTNNEPAKAVKPVAHYLDKMLDVVEESRIKLQDGSEYESMINELINRMGEVHTPDLIHAINRFHSFNQKLFDNLPLSFKAE
ncbi:DUF5610 domain-containing protein [Paraglaciecola sp.]|uniref:DUF5610 domain-containing protein n=1 Tax=Paraglaciecola sp. TaxID=1920173 RepID=UPI0030F3E7EC